MRTAAYTRFSTDKQSEASTADQARNIRAYCERLGMPAPRVFSDEAISGSRADRPGYRAMLRAAEHGEFDVLLVDDTYRLWRDQVEFPRVIRDLKFIGVRVIGVTDGFDSDREGYKLEAGMRGIMGEAYKDAIAKNTHRGLTGRALQGASAGGLPYGYRITEIGRRAIDEAQAAVVRRIFADYLAGRSAREIAMALNAEREPSARGSTWAMSAIHGDTRRGIGILANPIYCGRQIWNRSRWVRHPKTGNRVRKERPESEWIITEHPELAIVDAATFDAIQERLRKRRLPCKGGSHPKYILSGLLRCGQCGGPMVAIDRYRYGCAAAKDRGTCTSKLRVPRAGAEQAMLAGIREQLLSDEAFQKFQREVRAEMKREAPDPSEAKAKLAEAERLRENILAALRAGIITPSTKAELIAAEAAVKAAQDELRAFRRASVEQILPRMQEEWRRLVAELGSDRREEVREAVHELIGTASVIEERGVIYAETNACQIRMVAGAGFVPNLTEPYRFRLGRKV